MSTTTAISSNVQKNDGGTIFHAGTIANSRWANLTLAVNTDPTERYGSRVHEAVSPNSSGNVGTFRPLSAGVFGQMEVAQYVGKVIGTRIAQTDDTFLRSGAAETSNRTSLHYSRGNRRYDITDWSYITGAATKGGSEGDLFTFIDPQTGNSQAVENFPSDAVPGHLVFRDGSSSPIQSTYKPRTNP